MIENGKSASQRMNKGNLAGRRGLLETCARGKAIANNKAWRTGAMTRARSNFRIGFLNLSFNGRASFLLQSPRSRPGKFYKGRAKPDKSSCADQSGVAGYTLPN